MSSLLFLIPLALVMSLLGLAAFLWTLKSGQYDDMEGAAHRILLDDADYDQPTGAEEAGADADKQTQ